MYIPYAGDTKELLEGYALISADIAKFVSHIVKSMASGFRSLSVKFRFSKLSLDS
jgi:hypothetical protein